MRTTILSTGEELVRGATADTNAPLVARRLTAHGFEIRRMGTVGDDADALETELKHAARHSELIVLTGGLGPTADDRTRGAIARAAGRELVRDEDSLCHVRSIIEAHGVKVSDAHARQALFPEGADIFENARGTARGFACPVGNAILIAMPGVPDEMTAMFDREVVPFLLRRAEGNIVVRKINLFGVPESEVDERIGDLMDYERNPALGLTVDASTVSICLRARGESEAEAREMLDRDEEMIRRRFGHDVVGVGGVGLAQAVSDLLERSALTVALAESCTGGEVGSLLVGVPGISRFFLLDVVAYSNEAKAVQLGVAAEEIAAFGAVSPEVAQSMARGACRASGADVGASTTGIAGPTGGTKQKPVGLVYFGICIDGETSYHRLHLRGDRRRVKSRAARHALNFLRLALLEHGRRSR